MKNAGGAGLFRVRAVERGEMGRLFRYREGMAEPLFAQPSPDDFPNCFVLLIGMAVCLTIGAYLCKDCLLYTSGLLYYRRFYCN